MKPALRRWLLRLVAGHGLASATVDPAISPHLTPRTMAAWTLLIVGSDRRPPGDDVHGARADAIALVVCNPVHDQLLILRLPRDVWTELPGIGHQKLGWALDYGGGALLVAAVRELIGCPIHHYAELRFEGFTRLVDALGGIDLVTESPTADHLADLELAAGAHRLDGRTALALARSRHDGDVPLGDDARIERQNTLITGLFQSVNPLRALTRVAQHLTVDDRLDAEQLVTFVDQARRATRTTMTVPLRAVRSPDELRSPFPPHQVNTTAIKVFRQPQATLVLQKVHAVLHGKES